MATNHPPLATIQEEFAALKAEVNAAHAGLTQKGRPTSPTTLLQFPHADVTKPAPVKTFSAHSEVPGPKWRLNVTSTADQTAANSESPKKAKAKAKAKF